MVGAPRAILLGQDPAQDCNDRGGHVVRPCRGAMLVINDCQLVMSGTEPDHALKKVMPVHAVEPGRPQDEMARTRLADRALAGRLRGAIDAKWGDCIGLAIRRPA